uniref:Uncharacterized protein n=1 Tax=Panagrolaimus sp. ES5 TaxID=591445 RepID=A0AC34FS54_9BILA
MYESDVESCYEGSTARSTLSQQSLSQYSLQPSETAVDVAFDVDADVNDDIESIALSLITCATSVSEYSCLPSETNVSMSQLDLDREDLQSSAPFIDTDEADGFVYSSYELGPAETNVEIENCEMLYPQRFFPQLFAPEREGCDTPAPPQMFASVVPFIQ